MLNNPTRSDRVPASAASRIGVIPSTAWVEERRIEEGERHDRFQMAPRIARKRIMTDCSTHGEHAGNFDGTLHCKSAGLQGGEQHGRYHRAERFAAGEESGQRAGPGILRRGQRALGVAELGAQHHDRAHEAGDGAAGDHQSEGLPVQGYASVARKALVQAAQTQFVSGGGPAVDEDDGHGDRGDQQQSLVDGRPRNQVPEPSPDRDPRRRGPCGHGIPQRRADQKAADAFRRVREQPRGQEQRHTGMDFPGRGERGIGGAHRHARGQRRDQAHDVGRGKIQCDDGRGAAAERQLSVGAEIDDAGAQRDGGRQRHPDQRHRTRHGFENLRAFHRAADELLEHEGGTQAHP